MSAPHSKCAVRKHTNGGVRCGTQPLSAAVSRLSVSPSWGVDPHCVHKRIVRNTHTHTQTCVHAGALACPPLYCFERNVNETVAVSWHNINYPIKIEWVINCPPLPVLITLVAKGHFRGAKKKKKDRGEKERQDGAVPNKDLVRQHSSLCVYVSVSVCLKRGRKRQRGGGGGHIGGRLMWFSLGGPQRLGPQRKAGLLKRRERGRDEGVLLFILTCSAQSLTLASQLRCCGSSATYTKQWSEPPRARRWWEQAENRSSQSVRRRAPLEDQYTSRYSLSPRPY